MDAALDNNIDETISNEPQKTELVVEDGSCVSSANSYVSVEEVDLYNKNRNRTAWTELTENEKAALILTATTFVDGMFNWKGRRKFAEQELKFPRVNIKDEDGFDVLGIPKRLKEAICEAAFLNLENELFETVDINGNIKRKKTRQKVDGAVEDEQETEYFEATKKNVDYMSSFSILNSILKGLYEPKRSSKSVNAKARWRY